MIPSVANRSHRWRIRVRRTAFSPADLSANCRPTGRGACAGPSNLRAATSGFRFGPQRGELLGRARLAQQLPSRRGNRRGNAPRENGTEVIGDLAERPLVDDPERRVAAGLT